MPGDGLGSAPSTHSHSTKSHPQRMQAVASPVGQADVPMCSRDHLGRPAIFASHLFYDCINRGFTTSLCPDEHLTLCNGHVSGIEAEHLSKTVIEIIYSGLQFLIRHVLIGIIWPLSFQPLNSGFQCGAHLLCAFSNLDMRS